MFEDVQTTEEVQTLPQDYAEELQHFCTHLLPRQDYETWLKIIYGVANSWGVSYAKRVADWIGEEKQGEYDKLFKSYKAHNNPATIATLFQLFKEQQPQLFAEMQKRAYTRARERLSTQGKTVVHKTQTTRREEAVQAFRQRKTVHVPRELKTLDSATDRHGRTLYPVTCNDVIADKEMPKQHNQFWFSWWLPLQRLGKSVTGDKYDTHNLEWRICAGSAHAFTVFADEQGDLLTAPHERRQGRITKRRNDLAGYGRLFAVDVDKTEYDIQKHVQVHAEKATHKPIAGYYSASNNSLLKQYRFRLMFDFGKVLDYRDDYTKDHALATIAETIEQYNADQATKDLARVWFGNSNETQLHIFTH